MMRTLVVTLGVFAVSITVGFAQVIEWNTPTQVNAEGRYACPCQAYLLLQVVKR